MPGEHYVAIAVPFTVEEIERLTTEATIEGGSVAELIRTRVFGPRFDPLDGGGSETEDLTSMMARLEGRRIRARRQRRE